MSWFGAAGGVADRSCSGRGGGEWRDSGGRGDDGNRSLRSGSTRSRRETYMLVYPGDADISKGRLSVLAPIGTAILGFRVGDEVRWGVPAGWRKLRIEKLVHRPERGDAESAGAGGCLRKLAVTSVAAEQRASANGCPLRNRRHSLTGSRADALAGIRGRPPCPPEASARREPWKTARLRARTGVACPLTSW